MADSGYGYQIDDINQELTEIGGVTQPAGMTINNYVTNIQADPYPYTFQLNADNINIDLCFYATSGGSSAVIKAKNSSGTVVTYPAVEFVKGRPKERTS